MIDVGSCSYNELMKAIGIRQLKNRLSEYLRQVRDGERVLVTDRGKVVAELRSAHEGDLEEGVDPALVELARRGLLSLGAPNRPELYASLWRVLAEGRLSELLDEERQEP